MWLLSDHRSIGGLPPPNRPHLSTSEYARIQVNISLQAICWYLYGEDVDANRTPLTAELEYRWQIIKNGQFFREPSLRENTKRCMALHFSIDGEVVNSVTEPKGAIRKANLTFKTKFLWLVFRHCLSPPPLII